MCLVTTPTFIIQPLFLIKFENRFKDKVNKNNVNNAILELNNFGGVRNMEKNMIKIHFKFDLLFFIVFRKNGFTF